ncbi:MAG: C1 family peptidase [Saprospiraceae bacterium]
MRFSSTIIIFSFILSFQSSFGQVYSFKDDIRLDALPVISQDRTGTCWSYSTTSFLESEIMRKTGKQINLSEMYPVRQSYLLKAENYIYRQGKAQFDEGALGHDIINSMEKFGLMPADAFTGLELGTNTHNHREMVEVMKAVLNAYIKDPSQRLSNKWKTVLPFILDAYLGTYPKEFMFDGNKYTPETFKKMTTLSGSDYVTLTSFTHVPFYTNTILSIPDNFSNGSMYNVPLEVLTQVVDNALANGFTIALDCDVSEPTFSAKHGIAVIPANTSDSEAILSEIKPEIKVDQSYRQNEFEALTTTDDHLMHIVGTVKDQKGNVYYKVKNSWGNNPERVGNNGFIYMSKPYFQLKTISILLHRDGLLTEIKSKI